MTIQPNPATADLIAHRLERIVLTLTGLAERELTQLIQLAYDLAEPEDAFDFATFDRPPMVEELYDLAFLSERLEGHVRDLRPQAQVA